MAANANPVSGLEFALRIHQRFKGLAGDELVLPERASAQPVQDVSKP